MAMLQSDENALTNRAMVRGNLTGRLQKKLSVWWVLNRMVRAEVPDAGDSWRWPSCRTQQMRGDSFPSDIVWLCLRIALTGEDKIGREGFGNSITKWTLLLSPFQPFHPGQYRCTVDCNREGCRRRIMNENGDHFCGPPYRRRLTTFLRVLSSQQDNIDVHLSLAPEAGSEDRKPLCIFSGSELEKKKEELRWPYRVPFVGESQFSPPTTAFCHLCTWLWGTAGLQWGLVPCNLQYVQRSN